MDESLEFAIGLARQAGELLCNYFQKVDLQIGLKADHSLVTEADIASDRLIVQAIQQAYPQDLVLSEELQPSLLPELDPRSRVTWVIDPLDGTTNFGLGLHTWGVLLARLVNGWPELAVLYFPMLKELYTARLDQGAFFNGELLQARPVGAARKLSFFACCSRTFRVYQVDVPYKPRILGSTGYTWSLVARGIAILGFDATPKVWDIAGGWLLVREAGGVIHTLDGSQPFPLQPGQDYLRQSYPCLAGGSEEVIIRAQSKIIKK